MDKLHSLFCMTLAAIACTVVPAVAILYLLQGDRFGGVIFAILTAWVWNFGYREYRKQKAQI